MTVPHPLQQLGLFSHLYYQPIDRSTQIDRFPPNDAPCLCGQDECRFPFCCPPDRQQTAHAPP